MVSISLLPQEYRQLFLLRRRQARLLIPFGIITLLLLVTMGALAINGRTARNQWDSTMAYRQLLDQQLNSLTPFEEPYEGLAALNQIIQQIESEQVNWAGLLHQIGVRTPPGVWLTDFRGSALASGEEGNLGAEIALRGRALDHLQVARFLEQLENTPSLSNVKCLFSTGEAGQIQFEITASAEADSLTTGYF